MPNSLQLAELSEGARHTASESSSLLARKQQLVRGAIWDAAVDLFAKKGFDETTVEEIAQAARVSRRSFFRYFSSKNDLMGEGMALYAKTLGDTIAAFPPTHSLLEVLRQTVLDVAKGAAAEPRTRKIMQITADNPAAREAHSARLIEVQDHVAGAFAQRLKKRSDAGVTSRVLAGLTMSIFDVTFRSWFEHDYQDISVPAEQALAALHHLFCEEIGGREQVRAGSPHRAVKGSAKSKDLAARCQ